MPLRGDHGDDLGRDEPVDPQARLQLFKQHCLTSLIDSPPTLVGTSDKSCGARTVAFAGVRLVFAAIESSQQGPWSETNSHQLRRSATKLRGWVKARARCSQASAQAVGTSGGGRHQIASDVRSSTVRRDGDDVLWRVLPLRARRRRARANVAGTRISLPAE